MLFLFLQTPVKSGMSAAGSLAGTPSGYPTLA